MKLYIKNHNEFLKLITERGHNKGSFAISLNLSVATMSRLFNGGYVTPKTAKKIADSLNREITELFTIK